MTEVLIYNSRIFYADHQVGNYCLLIREVYLISAVRARIYVHETRKCTVYRNYKNYNGGGAQYRALIGTVALPYKDTEQSVLFSARCDKLVHRERALSLSPFLLFSPSFTGARALECDAN